MGRGLPVLGHLSEEEEPMIAVDGRCDAEEAMGETNADAEDAKWIDARTPAPTQLFMMVVEADMVGRRWGGLGGI